MKVRVCFAAAAGALLCMPQIARAQLATPVRAIIDAAIATGDPQKVATVVDLAKLTNPDDAAEIDRINMDFTARQQEKAAADELAKLEAIQSAGLLDHWGGKGEIGAFRTTGNSSNTGLTAGLKLERIGIDWRHNFRGQVNYQRTNGVTSREQFLAVYEPNYALSDRLYVYGLTQYERDRFLGYSARYSVSGGAGYRVIDQGETQLSIKAGPAYRETNLLAGANERELAALAAVDFDLGLTERIKLTENASVYYQSGNSTYISATGLEASLGGGLVARLSYKVEHDSNPPAQSAKTDTHSRFTVIYGF